MYINIEQHNPNRKCNLLIVFDYMIADIISTKNLSPIVIELFIRERKLNISTVLLRNSIFKYQMMLD